MTAALSALPRVSLPEPQGAFYAFPQIEGLTDSTALATQLLCDTGLAIAPGVAFGDAGEGYVRICFAATETTVTDALARLGAWMNRTGDQETRRD